MKNIQSMSEKAVNNLRDSFINKIEKIIKLRIVTFNRERYINMGVNLLHSSEVLNK